MEKFGEVNECGSEYLRKKQCFRLPTVANRLATICIRKVSTDSLYAIANCIEVFDCQLFGVIHLPCSPMSSITIYSMLFIACVIIQ